MVKHTQTISRQIADELFQVFDHFVELALKGLMRSLFRIVPTRWWWSEIPIFTVQDLKISFLPVRIKSVQDGLLPLKHVGIFIKFSKLQAPINKLRLLFSVVKLECPRSIKL